MTYELSILRAVMRLTKKSQSADVAALVDRVGGERADVRAALRRLDGAGLVARLDQETARLTLAGFALAVASVPARTRASQAVALPVAAKESTDRSSRRSTSPSRRVAA